MPTLREVIFDPEHNPLSTEGLRESIADARERAKRVNRSGFTSSGSPGATGQADVETPQWEPGPRSQYNYDGAQPYETGDDVTEAAKDVRQAIQEYDPSGLITRLKAGVSIVLLFAGIYVLGNLFNINIGGNS